MKAPTQQVNSAVLTCWSPPKSPGCTNKKMSASDQAAPTCMQRRNMLLSSKPWLDSCVTSDMEADRMTFKMGKIVRSVQLAQAMKWKQDAGSDDFPNWVWYWLLDISLCIHFGLMYICVMPFLDTWSFPISSGGFTASEIEYPRLFFRILGDIFGNMYCSRHSSKIKSLGTTKTPSTIQRTPQKICQNL